MKKDMYAVKELIGSKVICQFEVREDLDILRGHFPGNPILPGVVQVEIMAQGSIFLMTKHYQDPENTSLDVALLGVDNAKFRKPVTPGMKLVIESELTRARGMMMTYDCTIKSDGALVSSASILATIK